NQSASLSAGLECVVHMFMIMLRKGNRDTGARASEKSGGSKFVPSGGDSTNMIFFSIFVNLIFRGFKQSLTKKTFDYYGKKGTYTSFIWMGKKYDKILVLQYYIYLFIIWHRRILLGRGYINGVQEDGQVRARVKVRDLKVKINIKLEGDFSCEGVGNKKNYLMIKLAGGASKEFIGLGFLICHMCFNKLLYSQVFFFLLAVWADKKHVLMQNIWTSTMHLLYEVMNYALTCMGTPHPQKLCHVLQCIVIPLAISKLSPINFIMHKSNKSVFYKFKLSDLLKLVCALAHAEYMICDVSFLNLKTENTIFHVVACVLFLEIISSEITGHIA
ncbi:hypothetical protein ACJX0J_028385, partial [Zea mays]